MKRKYLLFVLVIVINFTSFGQIIAADDTMPFVNGAIGNPDLGNVLHDNGNGPDTLNGNPATISQVNLTSTIGATPVGGAVVPFLDITTGQVVVPIGTPASIYYIVYTMCEKINPVNCDPAIIKIIVSPSVINAINDNFTASAIDSTTGGTTLSVLANDALNGAPVFQSGINLTAISFPAGFTLNSNGTITIAPGTAAGGYTLTYQICEALNPNNCTIATVSLLLTNALLAPTGNSLQSLPTGSTLADLVVTGQDILWYAQNYAGKTQQFTDTPLPTTTILVDGSVYYASQTVGLIESTNRLPVTVSLTPLLANESVFSKFNYFPNPVKNTLTISNACVIDEIIINSILGQKRIAKKITDLQTEIDLSGFSNGIYFVKVRSKGQEKTIKIVKE